MKFFFTTKTHLTPQKNQHQHMHEAGKTSKILKQKPKITCPQNI